MRHRWIASLLTVSLVLIPALAFAHGQRAAAPAQPTPRWPDGRVNRAAPPGEWGLWIGGIVTLTVPNNGQVPYQPWAKAVADYRRQNEFEPHTRCKPSGGPRQFLTPYGVEFVDMPELRRMYIFDVGGPHTYRVLYMDGRQHPKDLERSYYGHSVG